MKKENDDRNGEFETNIAKNMPDSLESLPPLEQRRQTRLSELMQLEEEYIVEINRIFAKWKKVFGRLQIKGRPLSKMKDIQREIDEIFKLLQKSFDEVALQRTPFSKEKVKEGFYIDSIGCSYFNKVPEILAGYDVVMEYDNEEQIAFEDLSLNSLAEELYVITSDILDSLTHYFLRLQVCLKHVLSCTPRKHPDHHPLREIVQVLNKFNKENSSRKFGDIEKVRSESCPLPDVKKQSKVKRRYSWDNGTLKRFAKITRSISFVRNSRKHSSEKKNDVTCQESLKKDEFVKELVTTLDGSLKRCSTPKTKTNFDQPVSSLEQYNGDNREEDIKSIDREIINGEGTPNASFSALVQPIKSYSNFKNNILVDKCKISDSQNGNEVNKHECSDNVLAIPESSPTLIRGNLDFYSYSAENSNSESKHRSTGKGSLTPEDQINFEYLDVPRNTLVQVSYLSDEDSRLDKYIEEKTQRSYRGCPKRDLQTRVSSHVEKKKSSENRKISLPEGQSFKNQLNRIKNKHEVALSRESSQTAAENDNMYLRTKCSNETTKPCLRRLLKSRTFSDSATVTDNDIVFAEVERHGRRIKYKSIDNEEGTAYNTNPVTCSTKHPSISYEASMSPSLLVRTENVIMDCKSKHRYRKCNSELKTRMNSAAISQLKNPALNCNTSSSVHLNFESHYSKKQTVKIEGTDFADESKLLDDSSNDSAGSFSKSRDSNFSESSRQTNCVSLSTPSQGKDAFTQRRNFATGKENFNLTICSDFNKTVRSMLEASLSCVELYRNGITYGNSTFYRASNSNDTKKGRSVSTITSPSSNHQLLTKSLSNPSTSSVDNDGSSVNAVLNCAESYHCEFGKKGCRNEAENDFKSSLGSFEDTTFPSQKHTWQNRNSCNGNIIDTPVLNVRKLVDKKRKLSKARIVRWSAGIDSLLLDKNGIKVFQIFLRLEYSEENLLFWLACESFKSLSSSKIVREALKMYKSYIEANSAKEVNLDHETRVKIKEAIKNPNKNIFDQAQKRIKYLMAQDSYPRFIKSSMYQGMME